jgi:polyhydroxyalkanoate synthesis regulator phasin
MARKRKRVGRKVAHPRRMARTARVRKTATSRLRDTWYATLGALTSAEENLEKQIRVLLKRNKITTRDASAMLQDIGALIGRERRKALKELDARMKALQTRVRKERKVVRRTIDDAVQAALAAVNIPSRHEVHELTRKVDELSKKIDRFRR